MDVKISVITPTIRCKGLSVVSHSLAKQTIGFDKFEWLIDVGFPERGHDLNASYNRLLRRAQGELIVSLQDYIRIPEDGLAQFWEAYKKSPRTFFTAPVGKTLDWQNIQWDWRIVENQKPLTYVQWEVDWACAPREALFKIGGFDEELDNYWTYDNVNVGYRAHLYGYDFLCLPNNKAIAYDHDKVMKHPFRGRENPDFHNARLEQFKMGLKINYLSTG